MRDSIQPPKREPLRPDFPENPPANALAVRLPARAQAADITSRTKLKNLDDLVVASLRRLNEISYKKPRRTSRRNRREVDLLTEGISCGLHRIEWLMRLQALKASPLRQATAVAPNVLNRSFEASAPNCKWIADFTYVRTSEGWL